MNILFISHYAGSPDMGMVFRPYYFAKEWVKQGHSVTIVAASFTHIRKKNPDIVDDFQEISIDGIKYVWIKTPKYRNIVQRVLNICTFVYKLNFNAKGIAHCYEPDIVISSSTYNFDIYSAIKIAKYAKAKLVYEVRDLWPLTPIELGGYSKYNPFIIAMQRAENTAYKKADFVVSVLPCVHEYMEQHGLDLGKLCIIPNGVIKNDFDYDIGGSVCDDQLESFFYNEKSKKHIIVGYTGTHGNANALEYLLYAAKILNEKPITFVFFGSGKEKEKIKNISSSLCLKNVYFFEPIIKSLMYNLIQYFDITYIGWRNLPIYSFGISPNKLMDYMIAGKPVLHSVKAGNDPVTEAGCGITVEPENPQAIADGILKLASLSPEERGEMGKRGRNYILKNQTYDILAKKFLDFVTKTE